MSLYAEPLSGRLAELTAEKVRAKLFAQLQNAPLKPAQVSSYTTPAQNDTSRM